LEHSLDFKVLRMIQQVQLEMLSVIDKICRKNQIKYQLYSGTLLGAVRNKRYIPWDDDLDICLLRKDYDRLIEILKTELDAKYFVQTHETDPGYIHAFARIRKNNTLMLQHYYKEVEMHHGIFIDIFPLDKIMPNSLGGKLQHRLVYGIRRIKSFKIISNCRASGNPGKRRGPNFKMLLHFLLKPISMQTFNAWETKAARMFSGRETVYSTHLSEADSRFYHPYKIRNKDFYDTVEIEFEGRLFPAPRNYHEVLTNIFGDYKTPPPPERRIPHHGVVRVCFDTAGQETYDLSGLSKREASSD
jgi:lipopolysaccharide cholinephosphotransferase